MLRRTTVLGLFLNWKYEILGGYGKFFPARYQSHRQRTMNAWPVVEGDMMKSSASDELNVSSSSGQNEDEVAVPGKGSND